MRATLTSSTVRKAKEAGRQFMASFKVNTQRDENIKRIKLAQLNQSHVQAANGTNNKPARDLVEIFKRFHWALKSDEPRSNDYVGEIMAAKERGRAIIDAAKRGERNFPPARQVVKP